RQRIVIQICCDDKNLQSRVASDCKNVCDNIQTPAATQATPAARATHRPKGVSFSRRTSSARSAIQSTFITPPTNKRAIKTQQQPAQGARGGSPSGGPPDNAPKTPRGRMRN